MGTDEEGSRRTSGAPPYMRSGPDPTSGLAPRGKPPFFRSWTGMYLLVLGVLAAQVVVYYVLTRIYE